MPNFNFEATGIGSLPFKDSKDACRVIFDNFKSIPFWPQLPKRSYKEHMYCQFSEGLPGVVIDENKKTIHIDSIKAGSEIEKAYQRYIDADVEYFGISRNYAEGFYRFTETFKKEAKNTSFVKGHVTGPVSFALSVTDENKRSIIYNSDLFDVVVKVLSMKARWQIKKLKTLNPNVIIFIDEPYLVSIGSSFVNISLDGVVKALDEISASIKGEGALSGAHCCGNTDWSVLLKRDIDILNFDAYNFIKEFSLYAEDINNFFKKGGTIAWGIVPSSESADKETTAALAGRLKEDIGILIGKGIDKSIIRSIVTPSCGLGTLDEDRSEKILELTKDVSLWMKRQ